jgi:hypothetical protein
MVLLIVLSTAAFAAPNPSGTGQPNASCEESTTAPHGFSTGGFANAEEHYAGEGPGSANAHSEHAVSQYDVACYQLSNPPH